MSKPESETAPRLIAEMMDADGWHPRRKLADHPALGPIIARRDVRYRELLDARWDIGDATIAANTEAVQEIINACR